MENFDHGTFCNSKFSATQQKRKQKEKKTVTINSTDGRPNNDDFRQTEKTTARSWKLLGQEKFELLTDVMTGDVMKLLM